MNKTYTTGAFIVVGMFLLTTVHAAHISGTETTSNKTLTKPVAIYSYERNEFVIQSAMANYASSNDIFVIIHGANSSIQACTYLISLARSIHKKHPSSRVLVVDWSLLAKEEAKKSNFPRSVEELRRSSLKFEAYLVNNFPDSNKREDFVKRLSIKYIPLQAASRVDPVARQVFFQLFVNGMMQPGKTRLIGHSLGAHIAFSLAEIVKEQTGQTVNTLSLLEPAPEFLFERNDTYRGINWKNNVALHVVVYKTSKLFSESEIDHQVTLVDLKKVVPGKNGHLSQLLEEYCQHQMVWEVYRARELDSSVDLKKLKYRQAFGFIF
ncbi:MAG: hypothetical protein Q4G59_07460 [Planctomycetia bacterium]|nr:hypothetical protein [Planctomycetia bacterium]